MTDLITRLEGLSEPCRECDAEIALYTGITRKNRMVGFEDEEPLWDYFNPETNSHGSENVHVKYFTSSIDAALTLIPEGWAREVSLWPDSSASVSLIETHLEKHDDTTRWHGCDDAKVSARHTVEAIAICIASLRAREATKGTHHD